MIYFFSGTPGSGKSLDMARCILNDLRFNRPVICNFAFYPPVKLQNKEYVIIDNSDLNPKFLTDYSKKYFENHKFKEGAICLYIDECQLLFNARTWNIRGRDSWNRVLLHLRGDHGGGELRGLFLVLADYDFHFFSFGFVLFVVKFPLLANHCVFYHIPRLDCKGRASYLRRRERDGHVVATPLLLR